MVSSGATNICGGLATCPFVYYAMSTELPIDCDGNKSVHVHDFEIGSAELPLGGPFVGTVVTCHETYVGHDDVLDA